MTKKRKCMFCGDQCTIANHMSVIRINKMRSDHFSAFCTWQGYDIQEYGETQRNAAYFLLYRHMKEFNITEAQIPKLINGERFF